MVRPEESRKRSGVFTSLHFPELYTTGFTHKILIAQGTRVRFHFTSFNLQDDRHWVKIAQGSVGNLTPKLSGTRVPKDVTTKPWSSAYSTLYVEFFAPSIFPPVTEGGWRLEWNEIGEDEEIEENAYNEGQEEEEEEEGYDPYEK